MLLFLLCAFIYNVLPVLSIGVIKNDDDRSRGRGSRGDVIYSKWLNHNISARNCPILLKCGMMVQYGLRDDSTERLAAVSSGNALLIVTFSSI